MKIYSEVGEGTTVKVYLPRLVNAIEEEAGPAAPPPLPLGDAQEVVLVVEDEAAVRQFSVEALGELGYRVLEADGAAAALKLIDAHPEIDLLFTDVVMPDVNGRKLAEEALRRRPGLKVLFTTGYTRNASCTTACWTRACTCSASPTPWKTWRCGCARRWMRPATTCWPP